MRESKKSSSAKTAVPVTPHQRPVILYVGYEAHVPLRRRRLDGILRCAKSHGWEVATLAALESDPATVRKTIKQLRPVGCIVECWYATHDLPPAFFGAIPVVYFNPPERRAWREAAAVACDEAAVAETAFRELSAGLPPCYAVVAKDPTRRAPWARERVAAFRACCEKAGKVCHVFPELNREDDDARLRRTERWVAALPIHCAIFAVNDPAAKLVASALSAIGRPPPRTATLVGADAASIPGDARHTPDLSSVRIDYEHSGYLAAKIIADKNSRGGAEAQSNTFSTYGPLLVERRNSTRGHGRREPSIMKAVEIIRREACEGLTAAKLASRFPVSRKLFELRFREAVGHSVLNEILHVRMTRVFDLLTRPDFPIGAIADFCGFDSDRELRSLFRARTGTSMREWRQARR